MADQIYIGNFAKGLNLSRLPFNIDNDAFPTMFNFYSWRGRAKKKRGTLFLGRLQRQIQSVLTPTLPWQFGPLVLVGGVGNLITGPWTQGPLATSVTLEANSSITPGTIIVMVGGNTYTEPSPPDGTLLKNGLADPGSTINYATGVITIAGGVGPLTGFFSYFPDLPVLGLEDFVLNSSSSKFPFLLSFDTTYSYQINDSGTPVFFYSTSYYKGTNNPIIWSNTDSNQFWSTNYQSAFWVTNNKPGLHFLNATYISGSGTTIIRFSFTSSGLPFKSLIVGDKLWFNEWNQPTAIITGASQTNPVILQAVNSFSPGDKIKISGVVGMTQLNTGTFTISAASPTTITLNIDGRSFGDYDSGGIATLVALNTINGITGTVDTIFNSPAGIYDISFDAPQTVSGTGIVQMLTNSLPDQDGIRWYDGDPTAGTGLPTGTGKGWVNFAPPLTATSVAIDDQTTGLYYLVGALAILPFKDRLLFFGPQIQTTTPSGPGPIIKQSIQDMVLWSWNGTPYYSSLVPTNPTNTETYDPKAYYVDQTGFGGYLPAGVDQPIVVVNNNEDVILIGFGGAGKKTRFVYTGNDLQPFLFYMINSELPSSSTFSGVVVDKGGIEIGQYGITLTTQQSCDRIDLQIPDQVFQIQALNDGQNRVNAIRDFFREWIYFSYPTGDGKTTNGSWVFPSQTLMFNYRDNTWAVFRENFTHHGTYRRSTHYTWATLPFKTWADWREPWNAGSSQALFPSIVAGNPQGFVLIKGEGTGEARSGASAAILDDGFGFTQITSVNHCVNDESSIQGTSGDYLLFQNAIGSTYLNNKIGLVTKTIDANNFVVDIPFVAGTYTGLGTYTRLIQPLLQTKQFPFYWEQGRKVRLGVQKYLMDYTANGQITVNINLSQDPDDTWNEVPIFPNVDTTNSSLIYSQILFTCPESSNIGLTDANTNLQMPTALGQFQIWHRMNTSLIGDTFQIGITLDDAQMRDLTLATSEITLHGMILNVSPGPQLV